MMPDHAEEGIWTEAFCMLLAEGKKGDKILNLGCGTFKPQIPYFNIVHVDKDNAVNPDEAIDFNFMWKRESLKCDGILAMEVIEHLENPIYFVQTCCQLAKRFIIFTTPDPDTAEGRTYLNNKAWHGLGHISRVPIHLIENTAKEFGFEVANLQWSKNKANYILLLRRK